MFSGSDNMASLIGTSGQVIDQNMIEKNLNTDPTVEIKVQDVDSVQAPNKTQSITESVGLNASAAAAGGGRVRGWKDRLAKLREQKE